MRLKQCVGKNESWGHRPKQVGNHCVDNRNEDKSFKIKHLNRVLCFFSSCMEGTPQLKKWAERMFEDPAVKDTMNSVETHKAFYKTYSTGKPDYDYGL